MCDALRRIGHCIRAYPKLAFEGSRQGWLRMGTIRRTCRSIVLPLRRLSPGPHWSGLLAGALRLRESHRRELTFKHVNQTGHVLSVGRQCIRWSRLQQHGEVRPDCA